MFTTPAFIYLATVLPPILLGIIIWKSDKFPEPGKFLMASFLLGVSIILPLDLEKQTREKVTYALEYARYWGATIRVVSVVLRDNHEVRDKLTKNINQVEKFITDAGVKCTAELVEGEKKRTLGDFVFEYEKKFDADLIMIMTKKEELTLSDNISVTARYIINNSEIPVMSIRPKEQEYITGPTTAF